MQIVEVDGERRAQLTPAEQVINRLHDRMVGEGADAGRAARSIRASLGVRAVAVELDEQFWGWLGC